MRKPQTVKITWFPYPETKPKKRRWYLLTLEWEIIGLSRVSNNANFYYPMTDKWYNQLNGAKVIAWAELPEGYKEGE